MIVKSHEIKIKEISKYKFFLVYGENEGLKKDIINKIRSNHSSKEIKYEEAQVLNNKSEFYNEINNRSLFDENKTYLIERCSEKISEVILEFIEKNIEDLIIINCGILEKKSKLRNILEKSPKAIVIPTYKDNSQSLVDIAKIFFAEKKISVSYETLNLLANRSNGDRGNLNNELEKISNYLIDKKTISLKEVYSLTNLSENYTAFELVDASLSKNLKKTQEILNENNYSQEDSFLVLRVFLMKTKKMLNLLENMKNQKDIDKVILEHRPPIFWKDKPVIKKQLQLWTLKAISELIFNLNNIELKIKKNSALSLILMKNFIYEVVNSKN
ncbi:DNA polymerase III subunit delta [Candidatus Pelagibacter sp.]|nr:DNA polymerase III subunit delta [Candidatus Pelagibacter sp.]